MRTFTFKQALEVIHRYFPGAIIEEVWETVKILDIHFCDQKGNEWELISTHDDFFQKQEDFVIMPI